MRSIDPDGIFRLEAVICGVQIGYGVSLMFDLDSLQITDDSIYGRMYRGAARLKDGTVLPCLTLQSKTRLVELAKRRIAEELHGEGILDDDDPYGRIVSSFVCGGNRVNDYDIDEVMPSRYAIPDELRQQIHGETFMSWTGWVFEMTDGQRFSYGSSYSFEYFNLPDGYGFDDVARVHNHSYVDASGELTSITQGMLPPDGYDMDNVLRERVYFRCAIDSI